MIFLKKYRINSALPLATFLSFCAVTVFAQAENTVTIKFGDDSNDDVTGELVSASDTDIRLNTIMGTITIPIEGLTCIGIACPDSIKLVWDEEPVTLTSTDGSVALTGVLIEIVDRQYVLATDLGEFRIDIDKANCAGIECPEFPTDEVRLGGAVVLTQGELTVKGILTGYDEEGYTVDVSNLGELRVSREFACSGDGCP